MTSNLQDDVEKIIESWQNTGFSELETRQSLSFMGVTEREINQAFLRIENKKQ